MPSSSDSVGSGDFEAPAASVPTASPNDCSSLSYADDLMTLLSTDVPVEVISNTLEGSAGKWIKVGCGTSQEVSGAQRWLSVTYNQSTQPQCDKPRFAPADPEIRGATYQTADNGGISYEVCIAPDTAITVLYVSFAHVAGPTLDDIRNLARAALAEPEALANIGYAALAATTGPAESPAEIATRPTCDDAKVVVDAATNGDDAAWADFTDKYFAGDLNEANAWIASECGLGFE